MQSEETEFFPKTRFLVSNRERTYDTMETGTFLEQIRNHIRDHWLLCDLLYVYRTERKDGPNSIKFDI